MNHDGAFCTVQSGTSYEKCPIFVQGGTSSLSNLFPRLDYSNNDDDGRKEQEDNGYAHASASSSSQRLRFSAAAILFLQQHAPLLCRPALLQSNKQVENLSTNSIELIRFTVRRYTDWPLLSIVWFSEIMEPTCVSILISRSSPWASHKSGHVEKYLPVMGNYGYSKRFETRWIEGPLLNRTEPQKRKDLVKLQKLLLNVLDSIMTCLNLSYRV